MSKGTWVNTEKTRCYHGKIPTLQEFTDLIRLRWHKKTRKKFSPDNKEMMEIRYNSLLEDLNKSRFRDYKKSSYDFLIKSGLQSKQKKLTPRNKK